MKRTKSLLVILGVMLAVTACGKSTETVSFGEETVQEKSSKEKFNMKDVEWSVDEGIVDNERYVLLEYTNNSPYTIASFELTFIEKDDISEEEKAAYYSDLQVNFELDDEDTEELKGQPISIHAETEKLVNPGESDTNVNCYYYAGIYYLKDINHYNLVEPDIATIRYVDEDKVYTVYYDYNSEKYSNEEETEVAYQWSKTEIGNKIPKPDVKLLEAGRDDETTFMFDAYGMSLDQFNSYVEKCISLGYEVESNSFEGFYSANNAEGYQIDLTYDENDYAMSGIIKAPEVKTE